MRHPNLLPAALLCASLLFALTLAAAARSRPKPPANPLLRPYDTPFAAPPFARIRTEHFLPAFHAAMAEQRREIAAITANPAPADFRNTIAALDDSGDLLSEVSSLFFNLLHAEADAAMEQAAAEVTPLLTAHRDDIHLDETLFRRIHAVYEARERLALLPEQNRLVEKFHREFIRHGAGLDAAGKEELRRLHAELAQLELQFGTNQLAETNAFQLVIERPEDLAGLPAGVVASAAQEAAARGLAGKWVFTTQKPSMIPFLQYSPRRDLRERLYRGYLQRGDNDNAHDNKAILARIVELRRRRALLLGYPDHAAFQLENNMAQRPQTVYDFLERVWHPGLTKAGEEAAELQRIADAEGAGIRIAPWDWWYYAEKARRDRHRFDEESLRPYFSLEDVRDGVFTVAGRLFGIRFIPRDDIPVYHPDVRVFEVRDGDGSSLGLLYQDYFPRPGKRSGAWMDGFRKQSWRGGKKHLPLVLTVFNFPAPAGGQPSLLSSEEVQTFFHETGHALHGLLSRCAFHELSGTDVAVDFVELPSQILENWALEPEVLDLYARHFRSREPLPAELREKMTGGGLFHQGFATVEYVAAALLDLDWHTRAAAGTDVRAFEAQCLARWGLLPQIAPRYRSTYFTHIFSGGYSAGYYSYLWAQVLDADAFELFREKGLFDAEAARALREHIFSRGDSEEPMTLYRRFRGREPRIEPLLKRRGLLPPAT